MSHEQVKEYYGKVLSKTSDLKTNACCTSERPPEEIIEALKDIHEDVQNHYYGCGLVIPTDLENLTAIDLGSGAGRDCYILSKLVGEKGHVIGIDMTEEQLNIANKYVDYHTKKYGYQKPNIEFRKGFIEDLKNVEIEDNSVDLIVSNCVINLCPKKEDVLKECFRVLKEGGEMYFSDVYSERRVPEELKKDKVLYGECISGALYWNDFINLAKKVGFKLPLLVKSRRITIQNEEIEKKVEGYSFYSATYRLFKCSNLEEDSENFNDELTFKGKEKLIFDKNHSFVPGQKYKVCRNFFSIIKCSRFAKYFDFKEGKEHLGIMGGLSNPKFPFKESSSGSCCSGGGKKVESCCSSQKECKINKDSCCNNQTNSCCEQQKSCCCQKSK